MDVMICPCVACYSHVPLRGRHRCQENWHWQLRRLCSASKVPRRVCSQTPRIRETVCPRPRGASCPAVWTWVMLGLVLAKHWGRTTSRNGQPPETCENTNTNWSASNVQRIINIKCAWIPGAAQPIQCSEIRMMISARARQRISKDY